MGGTCTKTFKTKYQIFRHKQFEYTIMKKEKKSKTYTIEN